ncbi:Rpn family recombination-promoting nuclease/putative transposase [Sphingobacterium sp. UT-1RO-CII-1]|uniref:Rpn family recombination-promoting nuclease/putative transposase n=1 Tax=Sphingobacterium sp. UT-1RO-CII-1 TaxID=2995225 RepID=UPI00227A34E0|nr:Rpn family recombination-promoting nuclease/putative transposase [Sphingobacterium sp. UT-1RO-CII-1]MCY4779287.1 Rpn family recombination-promoting nuclease/putative transposase [Sphingobacterium sp. UT-1RO-CII-1]
MGKLKKHLGKYVDPRTDFGIKFYFGREENKILLIEFLNSLFEGEKVIADLKYKTVEHDGDQQDMRRVVFDLHCVGSDGEVFIVEFQQLFQEFFKDRAVFYTSRLINKQLARGKKGNDYCLPEVYFVGILEFNMDKGEGTALSRKTDRPYFYDVALCDKHTHEVFYDKLGYKLVSLPVFNKRPEELETIMDQWLYLLKHLSTMDKLPSFLDKRIFDRMFAIGEVGRLKEEDLMSYEASLKQRRDAESVYNSALRSGHAAGLAVGKAEGLAKGKAEGLAKGLAEGKAEGLAEGKAEGLAEGARKNAIETAKAMKKDGLTIEQIVKFTKLTVEEIEKL